ncbi:MAG: putative ABC transport system permease protein [Algoriphagus sp.]|jgi:putative ABC transport system permease protein
MIKNYLKIAWRSLQKNRAYGVINITGLMLSIAASILLFSFISFHLNFDSFHPDKERVYRIVTKQKRDVVNYQRGVPSPLGAVLREEYDLDQDIARMVTFDELQIDVNRGNEKLRFVEEWGVAFAEPSYFRIFNYPLLFGSITKEFEEPNKAFITESVAKKYFGEAQSAIGQSMKMDNTLDFTVIGILKDLPKNTIQKTEVFLSYNTLKEYSEWYISPDSWGGISSSMQCFIKLKPGVNPEQVELAMAPYPAKYRPQSTNIHTYLLQPLNDVHFNASYDGVMPAKTLWTLGLIALFLMISACLNFVNLATAQVLNRLKEVGVRKTLGSKKGQLFWQFLTETSLIAFVATILGYGLAYALLPSLNELFDSSISTDVFVSFNVIGFVFAIFIISTFVSGAYPGLLLSNFKPIKALKGNLAQVNVGGINLRRSLIIIQFVISQVLIIGMLVVVKQIQFSQNADLGFEQEAIVLIPIAAGSESNDIKLFKEQLASKASISSSTVCMGAPASSSNWSTSIIFGNKTEQEDFPLSIRGGDEGYLETFGLELLSGRNIRPADALNEVLVNETFLKKMNFASSDQAIGQLMSVAGEPNVAIVGVVKDFHDKSMHGDISAIGIGSSPDMQWNFAVKLNPANISAGLSDIEDIWNTNNPESIFTYEFVDESVKEFYKTEQTMLSLVQLFTIIAIFIGAMGLYGLVSFMVERKTKEIGVRKVLGSSTSSIFWLFGKEFSLLILVSFVISAPIAWWLSKQWLEDFKFQIEIEPSLFLMALALSSVIAFITISFKAAKAAAMDPVKSLKSE